MNLQLSDPLVIFHDISHLYKVEKTEFFLYYIFE